MAEQFAKQLHPPAPSFALSLVAASAAAHRSRLDFGSNTNGFRASWMLPQAAG